MKLKKNDLMKYLLLIETAIIILLVLFILMSNQSVDCDNNFTNNDNFKYDDITVNCDDVVVKCVIDGNVVNNICNNLSDENLSTSAGEMMETIMIPIEKLERSD